MHQDSCIPRTTTMTTTTTKMSKQESAQLCRKKKNKKMRISPLMPAKSNQSLYFLITVVVMVVVTPLLLFQNCEAVPRVSRKQSDSTNPTKQQRNLNSQYQSVSEDGSASFNSVHESSAAYDIRKLLEDYVTYLSSLSDYEEKSSSLRSSSPSQPPQESSSSRLLQSRSVDQISSLENKRPLLSSTQTYQSTRNKFNYPIFKQDHPRGNTIIVNSKPTLIATTAMPIGGSGNGDGDGIATTKFILELPTESGLSLNLSDEELNSFIDNVLGTSSEVSPIASNSENENMTISVNEPSDIQNIQNSSLLPMDTDSEDVELDPEYETYSITTTPTPLSLKLVSNSINITTTEEPPTLWENLNDTKVNQTLTAISVNSTETVSNITKSIDFGNETDSKNSSLAKEILTTTTTTIATTTSVPALEEIGSFSRAEIFENSSTDEAGINNNSNNLNEEEFIEMVSKKNQHDDLGDVEETNEALDSSNLNSQPDLSTHTTTQSSILKEINDNFTVDNSIDNQNQNSSSSSANSKFKNEQTHHDTSRLLNEMQKTKDLLREQIDFLQNFNISLNSALNFHLNLSMNDTNTKLTEKTESIPIDMMIDSINVATTTTMAPSIVDNSKYESLTEVPSQGQQTTTSMPPPTTTTTMLMNGNNNNNNILLPETTTADSTVIDTLDYSIHDPADSATPTQLPEIIGDFTTTTASPITMETTTETRAETIDTAIVKREDKDDQNSNLLQFVNLGKMESATVSPSTVLKMVANENPENNIPSTDSDLYRTNNSSSNLILPVTTEINERKPALELTLNGTNLNISGPIPTTNDTGIGVGIGDATHTGAVAFAAANEYRSSSASSQMTSYQETKPQPEFEKHNDKIENPLKSESETKNLSQNKILLSNESISVDEHHHETPLESEYSFRENDSNHGFSTGSSLSFSNNGLDNYLNETNDGETMILTHVPKITIIHKIVKPSGSRNGSQTDEEVYRETLRKHKHLIKTAMNSISLYPAAFKRYKLNSNSKVNSVGEIYLLPNFARTLVNSHKLLQQDSAQLESALDQQPEQQPQKQSNKKQFIQLLQRHLSKNQNKQVVIRQAPPHKKLKIKKISKDGENLGFDHRKFEASESIKSNDPRQLIVTADMDSSEQPTNEEEHRETGAEVFQFNSTTRDETGTDHRDFSSTTTSTTTTTTTTSTTTTRPEFQNPENILQVYRPRTLANSKRKFKRVKIPSKNLPRLSQKKKNDSSIHLNQPAEIKTEIASALDDRQPRASNRINSTPILFSIRDHFHEDRHSVDNHLDDNHPSSSGTTSNATSTTTTTTTTTVAPTRFTTKAPRPAASVASSPRPTKSNSLRKKIINHKSGNNSASAAKAFKVFCTYDAHRTLSFPPKENYGQFFDISQLEKNAAILDQCTHLVYAFANINMNGEVFSAFPNIKDDRLRAESEEINHQNLLRIQHLKLRFPRLRVLVAVGGWNTPPPLFSLLVATSKLRDRLCQNIHNFVLNYDFDGAIISWFYPVYGSKPVSNQDNSIGRAARSTSTAQSTMFQLDDKQNLIKLVRTLKVRFDSIPNKPLEIGLISPPFEDLIERGYDVLKLSEIVDHMILMTYDYYGSWQDKVHHFAPLYPSEADMLSERDQKLNINHTLSYWFDELKAPRNKTVMGLAFYGRSFTLENSSISGPGSPAIGPGIAGPITNKPGLLAFNELCDLYLGNQEVKLREDDHRITAHLQLFDQWVGFDDELSLYLKTKYAIVNRLSGVFIWSINWDDYRNRCGWGRFPLLKAVNKAVEHCQIAANQCTVV